jgi:hypothetical protein
LDHRTFLQWMSRWNSRRMSQGLRVLVLTAAAKPATVTNAPSPPATAENAGTAKRVVRVVGPPCLSQSALQAQSESLRRNPCPYLAENAGTD